MRKRLENEGDDVEVQVTHEPIYRKLWRRLHSVLDLQLPRSDQDRFRSKMMEMLKI